MKVTQMPPVHASEPGGKQRQTAYGVDVIEPSETNFSAS